MDESRDFRFAYSLDVRYGDIDAQGHVNNAKYITYMEAARFKYLERLGLFQPGTPWDQIGIIIAEVQCAYKAPLYYPETVRIYVRTAAVGTKSFTCHYRLERAQNGQLVALGRSVQVAYDYASGQSLRVPDEWRARIQALEEGPALDGQ